MNKLFNGDCLEVMRDLSNNSIDLLLGIEKDEKIYKDAIERINKI